jgi:class 3 adenylate cyclase
MRRISISIQSKLLLLIICFAMTAITIIGFLGYYSGKEALTRSVFNQLTSVRASKAYQVEAYLLQIRQQVQVLAEDPSLVAALRGFRNARHELSTAAPNPEIDAGLLKFYKAEFLPRLQRSIEGTPVAENHLPQSAVARYRQYHYIATNPHPVGKKKKLDAAADGSAYSQIHQQYHPSFRNWIEKFGYYDMLLIDLQNGDVLYSVEKEIDFGANLHQGALSESNLAALLHAVRKSPDRGFVKIVDYEAYRPSYMAPAAFIGSPIFDGTEAVGLLALQLPIDEIDRVMTGNREWRRDGLGETGEVYLVGRDFKMRSVSRFFVESPNEYFAALRGLGLSEREIERIRRFGTSILEQQVRSLAVERALAGKAGTDVIRDYRGIPVLSSYMPLRIEGIDWVIMAEIDLAEAFSPIYAFQNRVLITTSLLILIIAVAALVMTSWFLRPLHTMVSLINDIDKMTVQKIEIGTKDEYGILANSINMMLESSRKKSAEIERKSAENEALLRSILPPTLISRLRAGERDIAVVYSNVSVLHSQVLGVSALFSGRSAEQSIALLSELVGALDDAADRCQVEKLRTSGPYYVAVSGMATARLDHAQRVFDFAQEMLRIVRNFSIQHQVELALKIGLHAGSVLGGVIGRRQFNFDLFGETLRSAEGLQEACPPGAIYLSEEIHSGLRNPEKLHPLGELTVGTQRLDAWSTRG